MKPGELDIEHAQLDGRHVLHLSGELDLSCAEGLERTIVSVCLGGATSIELELGKLTFVDSAGLRAMLTGRQACERRGCEIFLTNCDDRIRRVLELTGMDSMLNVRSSGAEPSAFRATQPDGATPSA